jgi:archaellum component FlaC
MSQNTTRHWSELNLLVFERRAFRLQVRYLSHWDEIRIANKYSNMLQLPSVLLGGVASTAAFTTIQNSDEAWAGYGVASLTACMTILASLSQFFKFSESAEKHRDAAIAYEEILNDLGAIRRRGPNDSDGSFADIILGLDTRYMKVKTNAPMLSEDLIKKHSAAERELFNSINGAAPPTVSDIESAVRDTRDQVETQAVNAEATAERLREQVAEVKAELATRGAGVVPTNALRSLFKKVEQASVRSCIQNWQAAIGIVPQSAWETSFLRAELDHEKGAHDSTKLTLERERSRFRHEMERAANEGVMKERMVSTSSELDSRAAVRKLESELLRTREHCSDLEASESRVREQYCSCAEELDVVKKQLTESLNVVDDLERQNSKLRDELARTA